MDYFSRPRIVELAQLALDSYNSPDDDNLRKNEFNCAWIRKYEWPRPDDYKRVVGIHGTVDYDLYTGFYAAFYEHMITGVGVFAIRGTNPKVFSDIAEDIYYVFNKIMDQYQEALMFWFIMREHFLTKGLKKIYVCGHSLGGILAKMIAPITAKDTVAFNSPGVMQYLKTKDLCRHLNIDKETHYPQRVLNYCARADPIGNLRHDNDFSKYKFVDVLGGEQLPEKEDGLNNVSFLKNIIFEKFHLRFTKYHSMTDMYKTLKKSGYKDDIL